MEEEEVEEAGDGERSVAAGDADGGVKNNDDDFVVPLSEAHPRTADAAHLFLERERVVLCMTEGEGSFVRAPRGRFWEE